jgi:CheY-like chemotaxis protein
MVQPIHAKHPVATPSRTILFAEDNEQYRTSLAALLIKSGYSVITASDGKDALQKANEFDGTIDLLLSDVEMPGMTGIELAIQLLQDRPHTKVWLISGLEPGLHVQDTGWRFLRKPFLFAALRDGIWGFLSETTTNKRAPGGNLTEA